ncbi:hypothetical protein EDB85DRAFT_1976517, partial [Lactarius pseudohatsudake]
VTARTLFITSSFATAAVTRFRPTDPPNCCDAHAANYCAPASTHYTTQLHAYGVVRYGRTEQTPILPRNVLSAS